MGQAPSEQGEEGRFQFQMPLARRQVPSGSAPGGGPRPTTQVMGQLVGVDGAYGHGIYGIRCHVLTPNRGRTEEHVLEDQVGAQP